MLILKCTATNPVFTQEEFDKACHKVRDHGEEKNARVEVYNFRRADRLTGPIARGLSLVAIVVGGVMLFLVKASRRKP